MKLSALALAAAGIALMTGCSAVSAAAPAPSATPPASQPPSPAATATASPTTGTASASAEPVRTAPGHTMLDYQKGAIPEADFSSTVRKSTSILDTYSDDDLASIAQQTCAAIAHGETARATIIKLAAGAKARQDVKVTEVMSKDFGYLVVTGVQNYCPDLLGKITG